MAGRRKSDHLLAGRFGLEIEGTAAASFTSVSAVQSTTDVFEYAEGGDNSRTRKLIGATKIGNIVLRRGQVLDDSLFKWRDEIVNMKGSIKRRNCSIVQFDDDGTEKMRWNLAGAWPVRWEVSELSDTSNGMSVETLEIAPESITQKKS